MVVLELLEKLARGPVQDGVFDVRSELNQGAEHKAALVEKKVGDVEVVGSADHLVPVEEDVDVHGSRLGPGRLGRRA